MKPLGITFAALVLCGACSKPARAQQGQAYSAEWAEERQQLGACKQFNFPGLKDCGQTLIMGHPYHLALGSLAPQNGIGVGLAFTESWHPTNCAHWIDLTSAPPPGKPNPCHWSVDWNADAQATGNGSWRAGVYAQFTRISARTAQLTPHVPGQPVNKVSSYSRPSPVMDVYSQSTSLNRIYFYGLGPNTTPAARTVFRLTENVTGAKAIIPLPASGLDKAGISLLGELNGRFPAVWGNHSETSPSIETQFIETTAPGLKSQPAFLQAGEGIRLVPQFPYDHFRMNYMVNFQQFVAPSNAQYTFRRLTADLNHQIPLYGTRKTTVARGAPFPVYATSSLGGLPPVSTTRDYTGSISGRLLIVTSAAGAGSAVPFYFDPTMGGSDLNSQAMLPSYPDYRFRASNIMLVRGSFEQALGKYPLGLFFGIEGGKVGMRRSDMDFSNLRRSYSAGLTLHAGGLPVLYVLFAWGGSEGHHTTFSLANGLLGDSTRPSLF